MVCRIIQVSRSGYYSHKTTDENELSEQEMQVINCFEKHRRNYGRIRIRKELLNNGIDISEYKIARILKAHGLEAKSGRTGKPKKPKQTEDLCMRDNRCGDKTAGRLGYSQASAPGHSAEGVQDGGWAKPE